MTNNEKALRCHRCRRLFPRPHNTGRIPQYCSSRCRSASHRRRTATRSVPRAYEAEVVRLSNATLSKARAMAHRSQHPVPALPLEVLQICVTLSRDLEDVTAVAVRQALADGATWKDIATLTNSAESTLKSRYSQDKVDAMLTRRKARGPGRPRQPAVPGAPDEAGPPPGDRLLPGQPGYLLSCALSYLRRTSDNSVCSLAYLAGVSASYVYRITSGERTPTWEVTKRFALACETDPNDLVFLWNTAHLLDAPAVRSYGEALRALLGALRGLYLAASCPSFTRLRKPNHLTPRAAEALLTTEPHESPADCYLRWPVVKDLTLALQGDPQTIRPLWDAVESPPPPDDSEGDEAGPSLPAAAFG